MAFTATSMCARMLMMRDCLKKSVAVAHHHWLYGFPNPYGGIGGWYMGMGGMGIGMGMVGICAECLPPILESLHASHKTKRTMDAMIPYFT